MSSLKKSASVKIVKSIKRYLVKVKPRQSKNFFEKNWNKISDLILGLIIGQSCFLNTIAENTLHYTKKKEKGKCLVKTAQIEKLSGHLLYAEINQVTSSFLNYLQKLFRDDFPQRIKSIKRRIYEKKLVLHDMTDIQKPDAYKMENLCTCRDGSCSSAKKTKTGKGYLVEGCGGYWKGRFYPFILNLYSYVGKDFQSEKKEVEANLEKEKSEVFYPLEKFLKKLKFKKYADYTWFSIAWEKIYIQGEDYPKKANDILPVYLISVRLNDEKKEGIEEDIFEKKDKRGEHEIHLYTTENVETIEDAIVLFFCYLKRWKIETYFRFLKQVFGLEKVKLEKFEKIKNLLKLLPIATNFLCAKFHEFQQIEEQRNTINLNQIFQKDKKKRSNSSIEQELLFFWYKSFCREKGLTENPDSFAKAIHNLAGNEVNLIIDYQFYDSG